jgi:hypothetical protein
MILAALPQEVTDAVTIMSGVSLLGGVMAWLGWLLARFAFGTPAQFEHWVGQWLTCGATVGLLVATIYLAGERM